MTKRGRPPHPDVLTPREWEVLTLVRAGLTNPQIAERMSITLDAAKYHVSEILSKLQLSSREEAAAWQPPQSVRPVLRPAWASALGALFRSWPLVARIGGTLVMAGAVAGLGVLLYGVVKSESSSDSQVEATGSATPTFVASASPTIGPVPNAIPVSVGGGIDFPQDVAFIIENGCDGCDGGISTLTRVYRNGDSYVTDNLFDPAENGLGPITVQTPKGPEVRTSFIVGYAAKADASNIVVGASYYPDLGPPSGPTQLFRSTDGGITWQSLGELPAGNFLTGDMGPYTDDVLVGRISSNSTPMPTNVQATVAPTEYFFFPSNEPLDRPEGAGALSSPFTSGDGTITWYTDDGRLLDREGNEVARIAGSLSPYSASARNSNRVAIWRTQGKDGYYFDQFEQDNHHETYDVPGLAFVGPELGKSGTVIATINLVGPTATASDGRVRHTLYPAVLDLATQTAQPIIHPFGDADYNPSRNRVTALAFGPFDKVIGTGSCLNVRKEPRADAQVAECVADGVLLYDSLAGDKLVAATPIDGWREVSTPSGQHGYASSDFLQVIH